MALSVGRKSLNLRQTFPTVQEIQNETNRLHPPNPETSLGGLGDGHFTYHGLRDRRS